MEKRKWLYVVWFLNYLVGACIYAITNRVDVRYMTGMQPFAWLVEKTRVLSLRMMGARIEKESFVRCGGFITAPERLILGKHSKIGIRSQLWLYDRLVIGDDVEIGSDLIVHTAEHVFPDMSLPIAKQGSCYKPVAIGSDVYIGSRVVILPGVTICNHVIIGAGAVITGDCESGYVYAGVPARPICMIDDVRRRRVERGTLEAS